MGRTSRSASHNTGPAKGGRRAGCYSIASLRAPRQHVTEKREGGGWWILDCVGWVGSARLKHVDAVEVLGGLHQALGHELLAAAQGHARVVVLLVGLLVAVGVANLALQVRAELGLVRADAIPEGPLRVGVNVHLDGARLDGVADVLARRARAAVEDER